MPNAKQTLRLVAIFSITSVSIVFLSAYIILNSSWFWQKVSTNLFSKLPKDIIVKSITIQQPHVLPLAVLDLRKIDFQLQGGQDAYTITIDHLVLDFSSLLNHRESKIICLLEGMNVSSKQVHIKDGKLKGYVELSQNQLKSMEFDLTIPEATLNRVVLTDIRSKVVGNGAQMTLNQLSANLYDGNLEATIQLTYAPALVYEVKGIFNKINLAKLKDVNEEIASKLRGLAEGNIFVQGNTNDLDVMKIYVNIPEQAQMKASLLAPLIVHIPKNSLQRKDLELLMKVDGFVLLDQANLSLESSGKEQIKSMLNLDSNRFDLNVRLSTDINLSGGLLHSLESLQQVLQLIGGDV